jgi:hypothetical protein
MRAQEVPLGLRSLISRAKRRFVGAPAGPKVGAPVRWEPALAEDWTSMRDEFKLCFQTMASATVASWEVASADLHRRLRDAKGQEVATPMLERFSDSLVPSLAAIQDAERGVAAVWKKSEAAAQTSGTMEQPLALVAAHARSVGAGFAEGWPKTVAYLEPLHALLGAGPDNVAALAKVGEHARKRLDDRAESFAAALARVAVTTPFMPAFQDACYDYRHGAAGDLEVVLEEVRQVMDRALRGAGA